MEWIDVDTSVESVGRTCISGMRSHLAQIQHN
jgi:hypothetical protein